MPFMTPKCPKKAPKSVFKANTAYKPNQKTLRTFETNFNLNTAVDENKYPKKIKCGSSSELPSNISTVI